MKKWFFSLLALLACLIGSASVAETINSKEPKEPKLSASQLGIVNSKIATLRSPVDRHVAKGWSNAKKVAELLCRPAALPILKGQTPDVDRVFLGTDDPHTLNLQSNKLLTGSGEFRTAKGWRNFSFTCELDPETGKVSSFLPVLASGKP